MDLNQEKNKRMQMWAKAKYAPPLKAVLNITYKCNLNCIFCGDAVNRKNGNIDYDCELEDEEWVKVVKDCGNLGVKEWWFPGIGEPLMREELLKNLIGIIKSFKGQYCKITSNGTLLDYDFLKEIINKEVDEISLSLDSVNPVKHNYLRGQKGSFERLVHSARTLKRLKTRYKKNMPIVSINFVLNRKNYQEFKSLIVLAKNLGIQKISVNPLRVDSGNYPLIKKENLRLTKKQMTWLKEDIPSIHEYAKSKGIQFDINSWGELEIIHNVKGEKKTLQGYNLKGKSKSYKEKLFNAPCHEPWYCLAIDPFGNIAPCTSAGDEGTISNLKESTISEIWQGKSFNKIRQKILDNHPLGVCSKCLASLVRLHSKQILGSKNVQL